MKWAHLHQKGLAWGEAETGRYSPPLLLAMMVLVGFYSRLSLAAAPGGQGGCPSLLRPQTACCGRRLRGEGVWDR